MSTILTHMVWP